MPDGKGKHNTLSRTNVALIGFMVGFFVVGASAALFYSTIQPPEIIDKFTASMLNLPEGNLQTTMPLPTLIAKLPLLSEQVVAAYDDILLAERFMENEEYSEAIITWNRVIKIAPKYPDAYFQRGFSYLKLTDNQRIQNEALNNGKKAYEDISIAIELNPYIGDYYVQRAFAAEFLSGTISEFWVNRLPWEEQYLEDILKAYELGSNYTWGNSTPGFALQSLGRCEEALDFFERILQAQGDVAPSANTLTGYAGAHYCLGNYAEAVIQISKALEMGCSYCRNKDKALFLVQMENYEEALIILDQSLEDYPSYDGARYFLRAQNYYEIGMPELAYENIRRGEGNTWNKYGTRAYVLGRLAIDDGDIDTGLEWLQLAAASLWPYSKTYDKAVSEIERLGAIIVYPIPIVSYTSPTILIPAVSDQEFYTPTPPSRYMNDVTLANYFGVGPIIINPIDFPLIMFRPSGYPRIGLIKSVTIRIVGGPEGQEIPLLLQTYGPVSRGYGNSINLTYGEHELSDPQRWVSPQGYVYIFLRNLGDEPFLLENIQIQVVMIESNGSETVLGYSNE